MLWNFLVCQSGVHQLKVKDRQTEANERYFFGNQLKTYHALTDQQAQTHRK
jgi:hypothetical protein